MNKEKIFQITFEINPETLRISEELYQKFYHHSRRYYNSDSYETILENLLNNFEEHNKDRYWYNMDR